MIVVSIRHDYEDDPPYEGGYVMYEKEYRNTDDIARAVLRELDSSEWGKGSKITVECVYKSRYVTS